MESIKALIEELDQKLASLKIAEIQGTMAMEDIDLKVAELEAKKEDLLDLIAE